MWQTVSIGLSFTPLAPATPFFMAAGLGIGIAGALLDVTSAVFYGVGYGWSSKDLGAGGPASGQG
ncbi:hypothetical protein ACIGEZ_20030 [Streptomyces sp. NPDC085481]|uniref:hypothetical protein n=1 Tax=Streptomyces sp. NPDC085481 TaxID=3365727 RepID=UPI0037D32550